MSRQSRTLRAVRALPPSSLRTLHFFSIAPNQNHANVDAKIERVTSSVHGRTHATTVDRKEGKVASAIFQGKNSRRTKFLPHEKEGGGKRERRQVFWSRVNEPVLRINLTILRLRMGQMNESRCIEERSFAPLKRCNGPSGSLTGYLAKWPKKRSLAYHGGAKR